jgi:LEA14-like dessication related protein
MRVSFDTMYLPSSRTPQSTARRSLAGRTALVFPLTFPLIFPLIFPLMFALTLAGCAHLEQVVERPEVRITGLRLISADVHAQRYGVELALYNPNPFAMPVRELVYAIELNGRSFASGTADAGTRLPAREEVPLALTVETDLVATAQQLFEWLRRGDPRFDYRLTGEVHVDLPGVRGLPFERSGIVELQR